MKNDYSRLLILLIFISMIGIAIVPVVTAADAGSSSSYRVSNATPEQLEKINALWGTDITIGEYMEQVHPEHLVGVPDDVKKIMYQQKMIWPDEKNETRINETRIAQLSRLTPTLSVSCTISKVSIHGSIIVQNRNYHQDRQVIFTLKHLYGMRLTLRSIRPPPPIREQISCLRQIRCTSGLPTAITMLHHMGILSRQIAREPAAQAQSQFPNLFYSGIPGKTIQFPVEDR